MTLWMAHHKDHSEDSWKETTGIPFNDDFAGGQEFVDLTHKLTKTLNDKAGYERFRFIKIEEDENG